MKDEKVKEIIKSKLLEIEKKENFKIIFACESGSRSWNIHSPDSDYDVRFVYVRPLDDYIGLYEPLDNFNRYSSLELLKGHEMEFVGYDIKKFMRLLLNSNPTVIEWMLSETRYIKLESHWSETRYVKAEAYWYDLFKLICNKFNRKSLCYHYKSMCKQNYIKYIGDDCVDATAKKYLYCLRAILNYNYILDNDRLPPMDFYELVDESNISVVLKNRLLNLIELKKGTNESFNSNRLKLSGQSSLMSQSKLDLQEKIYFKDLVLLDYIKKFLKLTETVTIDKKDNYTAEDKKMLNDLTIKIIKDCVETLGIDPDEFPEWCCETDDVNGCCEECGYAYLGGSLKGDEFDESDN